MPPEGLDADGFERSLLIARRRVESATQTAPCIVSLSGGTLAYKGMVMCGEPFGLRLRG